MLIPLYSACIFQKVFTHRVTTSQGRNRGYLDISSGGQQREDGGSVPGSGGREMECFPFPAMALGSRRLARCLSFAVKWCSEHLPPYVTGFEGGNSDVEALERHGKCSHSGSCLDRNILGGGWEVVGTFQSGGGMIMVASVQRLFWFSADLTI